jgi:NAD(P)-dependent dehydrogenase (short-subunit alcohol dehydrogenase family)
MPITRSARLTGRTALVTGSTYGIGAAIARALAAEGADVVISGRDAERGALVADSINEARSANGAGGQAHLITADLSGGIDAVQGLADAAVLALGGPLDILVNNVAQLISPSPSAQITEQQISAAFALSVTAPFLLTGLLAPAMVERGSGAIVNMGSINGLFGMGGSALYSATKAAMHSLTKSWAAEYGPFGVRVNAVAPGPTLTEKVSQIQEYLAPMIAAMPSRRASAPEEVAAAVVFLASDDAANIHGAILSVDGGRSAV